MLTFELTLFQIQTSSVYQDGWRRRIVTYSIHGNELARSIYLCRNIATLVDTGAQWLMRDTGGRVT